MCGWFWIDRLNGKLSVAAFAAWFVCDQLPQEVGDFLHRQSRIARLNLFWVGGFGVVDHGTNFLSHIRQCGLGPVDKFIDA
jgi:hypothetical protein